MLITLLVALFIIGADQLSKYLVVGHMTLNQTIPVIDGALYLHYVRNNGAAFSMLRGFQWLFIVASIVASIGIVVYLARTKTPIHWLGLLSLGLILGGALGNLFDRLMHANHEVIDFIYVNIHAIKFDFAIFNVADSGVSVGAVLLCIYIIFVHEKYVRKMKAKKPEEPEVPVIEQTEN